MNVKITKELMRHDCGTNNRVPQWTFIDPWKPEMGPGVWEESLSSDLLAAHVLYNFMWMKTVCINSVSCLHSLAIG